MRTLNLKREALKLLLALSLIGAATWYAFSGPLDAPAPPPALTSSLEPRPQASQGQGLSGPGGAQAVSLQPVQMNGVEAADLP